MVSAIQMPNSSSPENQTHIQRTMANETGSAKFLMNTPRFATAVICFRTIYQGFVTGGLALGLVSAILTALCVTPLFSLSEDRARNRFQEVTSEQNQSSQIFTEVQEYELTIMREEEHSAFGRIFHQVIEFWSGSVEEFGRAAQVIRENQGLLILLVGGVSSMMMALVAGLEDVHLLKAFVVSITCYGATTLLVARSTRSTLPQRMLQSGERLLSSTDVTNILRAIPEEKFVPNEELESCDLLCIESMLHSRQKVAISQKANTGTEDSGCTLQSEGLKKERLIADLKHRRNYNDSCCICLSAFHRGEKIRVLPTCHHEFHKRCIDEWAGTFGSNTTQSNCIIKMGNPTCPLCNACLGEAKVSLPTKTQHLF